MSSQFSSGVESSAAEPRMMSLTALNYLNIVAYLLNTVVTYGIGYTNLPSTQDLSAKYQTIITPAGFAFSIWGIIFLAEAVFCVAQVFPAYRSSSLVVKGVGYSYVGVCVAQAIWSIAFEFEQIILSLIAMLTILFFLLRIVNQLYKVRIDNEEEEDSKRRDYWLTVFPFSIHAGWILVASLVNINLVFVRFKAPANVQLAIAITSIVLIYIGTAATLQSPYEPNYVIPTVFAWALFGIYSELSNPKPLIGNTFPIGQIYFIRHVAAVSAVVVLACAVMRVLFVHLWKSESRRSPERSNLLNP